MRVVSQGELVSDHVCAPRTGRYADGPKDEALGVRCLLHTASAACSVSLLFSFFVNSAKGSFDIDIDQTPPSSRTRARCYLCCDSNGQRFVYRRGRKVKKKKSSGGGFLGTLKKQARLPIPFLVNVAHSRGFLIEYLLSFRL